MKKILVVEDEAALREAFVMILDIKGYKTEQAENGKVALGRLDSFHPDVIILDILMPKMTGLEFLEAANLRARYPSTKVIVLSNLSDEQTKRQVEELKVDRFLLKSSVSPVDLVAEVEKQLS